MIQSQRLFPLAVVVTSCFISFLLADTLSAISVNSEDSSNSRQQRELPQQQQKFEPNIAAASAWHIFYNSLLNGAKMDQLKRGVPGLVRKKRANEKVSSDTQVEDHIVENHAALRHEDESQEPRPKRKLATTCAPSSYGDGSILPGAVISPEIFDYDESWL